jgi:hypothetical protein
MADGVADMTKTTRQTMSQSLIPSTDFCFGRDELIGELHSSMTERGCALLFGGRFSGKTTTLLRLAGVYGRLGHVEELELIDVPVYVNLLRLAPGSGPSEFWNFLSRRLAETCQQRITGFRNPLPERRGDGSLEQFETDFLSIRESAGELVIRVFFLIDETSRILGERFPHGVQDNLFALLYGADGEIPGAVSMLFTGAQDLYKFFIDQTSPIGSRASLHFLNNLNRYAISEMANATRGEASEGHDELVEVILEQTGGHAGLARVAALQANDLLSCPREQRAALLSTRLTSRVHLMQVWNSAFSHEAADIRDQLRSAASIERTKAIAILESKGRDGFRVDRAFEELKFTGVAVADGDGIASSNRLFWSYLDTFPVIPQPTVTNTLDLWKLIERTELILRDYVKTKYIQEWGGKWETKIRDHLGEDAWSKIVDNVDKLCNQYRYTKIKDVELFSGIYMGQLLILMIHKAAWRLFNKLFRDKREAEDKFKDILPVRNDTAHFREVPHRETLRCQLACEDVLFVIERQIEADTTAIPSILPSDALRESETGR